MLTTAGRIRAWNGRLAPTVGRKMAVIITAVPTGRDRVRTGPGLTALTGRGRTGEGRGRSRPSRSRTGTACWD